MLIVPSKTQPYNTVQCKILVGENFGEFSKLNAIRQHFTQIHKSSKC